MNIEIWKAGYICSDGSATASLLGTYDATDFDTAVEMYLEQHPDRVKDHIRGKIFGTHTIWGCRLYDNEADARHYFG